MDDLKRKISECLVDLVSAAAIMAMLVVASYFIFY